MPELTNDTPISVTLSTLNGQTLTVVRRADPSADVTIRIAKDGHNRAVAKLAPDVYAALSAFLAPLV